MPDKRLDFGFELRIARENFRFQFFSVEYMCSAKFDPIAHQYPINLKNLSPEIQVKKEHADEEANDYREQQIVHVNEEFKVVLYVGRKAKAQNNSKFPTCASPP